MRGEYVALVGSDSEKVATLAARIEQHRGYRRLRQSGRLTLLIGPASQHVALDGGDLVGWLFSNGVGAERLFALGAEDSAAIRSSGGRILISRFWGGYVGFLSQPDGSLTIVRDPSGAVPCYHLENGGVTAFTSNIDVLFNCGWEVPAIDWGNVRRQLAMPNLPSENTALCGVRELPAGAALTIRERQAHVQMLWSPWDYVAPVEASDDELARALREVVGTCVGAWASCFDTILLGVSGGLDSSIVGACITEQPGANLSCFTMATRSPDGDERVFARSLADAIRAPLVEAMYAIEDVDVLQSGAAPLPRPGSLQYMQANEKAVRRMLDVRPAQALFSGNGGDNIFCFLHSASPVVDRLRAEGVGAGFWRSLQDLGSLHHLSLFRSLLLTLRRRRSAARPYKWPADYRFLIQKPGFRLADFDHPWLAAPPGALPGKLGHIVLLLRLYNHLQGLAADDMPHHVMPLLSQPIVEFCLHVPSWRWLAGGVDRAPARRAFADILPKAIIERQSKGGPDTFLVEILEARRTELRSLLLDGLLVRHAVVDRSAVEAALDRDGPEVGSDYLRLLMIADAEAWARAWDGRLH